MDFNFSNILKRFTTRISRRIMNVIGQIADYYTPLSVIVISIVGGILIIISCYIGRYNFYDYWNWKSRAFRRVFLFILTLILIKLILGK